MTDATSEACGEGLARLMNQWTDNQLGAMLIAMSGIAGGIYSTDDMFGTLTPEKETQLLKFMAGCTSVVVDTYINQNRKDLFNG